MLTEQEEKFIKYWEENRTTELKSFKQYLRGLSRGLLISAAILVLLISGWYTRANMEANSKLSFTVFSIALLDIAIFMAWLYNNYKWEMNEQQYLELMAKKKKLTTKNLSETIESKENILD